MVPFYLITGFLGSGKTTLLKNILAAYANRKKIAIIQNEFAPSGADGKELQFTGHAFKLVEINNGSVFCVCMLNNFIQTLQQVVQSYKPDLLFLEASGLADPVNIIELLQSDEVKNNIVLSKIITLVDAPNFTRGMRSLTRFKHQIMIADMVIVNKTDHFDASTNTIHEEISKLNPFCEIIDSAYCNVPLTNLVDEKSSYHQAADRFIGKPSGGRPDFNACILRIHGQMTHDGLKLFIFELQKTCPRIKGFVRLAGEKVFGVQSVFAHFEIKEISDYQGPNEIIGFGKNLTVKILRNAFKKYSIE